MEMVNATKRIKKLMLTYVMNGNKRKVCATIFEAQKCTTARQFGIETMNNGRILVTNNVQK